MASLIFALCAVLLCLSYEWHAWEGRKAARRGNPVPDLRDAEAWATQLDRDLCDHWETPPEVARETRSSLVVNAIKACAVEVAPMRMSTGERMALLRDHRARMRRAAPPRRVRVVDRVDA